MTDSNATPQTALRTPQGPVNIPQLGFGVWKVPDAEVTAPVLKALEVGYRHIDTARIYGNEEGVGRALAQTDVPRDDIFVTTKVWNADQGFDATLRAFDASAQRLGLGERPLDCFLLHWPCPELDTYVETWKAMQRLRDEGRVRVIGTCNHHEQHLRRLIDETGEAPAMNQVETHPYLTQAALRAVHDELGIVSQSWSPLAQGGDLLADPVLGEIAKAVGRTVAQVVIRWHLQLGNVVIPKSVTPSRIEENFDVFSFELTQEQMDAISGLDRGLRTGPDPETFNNQ